METVDSESKSLICLDPQTARALCSGQVVVDMSSAAVQLLENAIDAKAKSVTITFRLIPGSGEGNAELQALECADDGVGIRDVDIPAVARRSWTSKLTSFEDLGSVTTYGFRGEALNSLCTVARLEVFTKSKDEGEIGKRVTFGVDGEVDRIDHVQRTHGTTVTISDLFYQLPVRKKVLQKSLMKEITKAARCLEAYGLITPGIKIIVQKVFKGKNNILFRTSGSSSLRDNVISIYGSKQMESLIYIENGKLQTNPPDRISVSGFISALNISSQPVLSDNSMSQSSSSSLGRSSADRQFCFVNHRPVECPKICKAINSVYRGYSSRWACSSKFPIIILDFKMPPDSFDINISPDKRNIMIHEENTFIESLKRFFEELFEPSLRDFQVNHVPSVIEKPTHRAQIEKESAHCDNSSQVRGKPLVSGSEQTFMTNNRMGVSSVISLQSNMKRNINSTSDSAITDQPKENSSKRMNLAPLESDENFEKRSYSEVGSKEVINVEEFESSGSIEEKTKQTVTSHRGMVLDEEKIVEDLSITSEHLRNDDDSKCDSIQATIGLFDDEKNSNEPSKENFVHIIEDDVLDGDLVDEDSALANFCFSKKKPSSQEEIKEIQSQLHQNHLDINFDIFSLNFQKHANVSSKECCTSIDKSFADDEIDKSSPDQVNNLGGDGAFANVASEAYMKRTIKRTDFDAMKVLGQFNLGFIIAQHKSDLYIIDQHAADEKFKFEALQKSFRMETQPLVQLKPLELSNSDVMVIKNNLDVFQRNGFQFEFDDENEHMTNVYLKSIPSIRNYRFDIQDIFMLIEACQDDAYSSILLPKVKGSLASRACRTAIMIGDTLSQNQMSKVVANMALMEQPWNCPHGRPTMRHLFCLNEYKMLE